MLYQKHYWTKHKPEWPQASLCVNLFCSVFFFIPLVSFPSYCLSLEAETWRRRASLALSATDKYWVSELHIYRRNKSRDLWKLNIKNPEFSLYTRISDVCRKCESLESVTLWLVWELFVIMSILLAMVVLEINDIPFRTLRN